MSVPVGPEEGFSSMSRQIQLFRPGRYSDLWGTVFPWNQETSACLLHLWSVAQDVLLGSFDKTTSYYKYITLFSPSVPQYLLEDMDRGSSDPFLISDGEGFGLSRSSSLGFCFVFEPWPSHLQVDGSLAPPTGLTTCFSPTLWRSLKKCWVCSLMPV